MTGAAEFALVPIRELRAHERIEESSIAELVELLKRTQVVADPIWVARDSSVILNGHHRVEALRRIGATRVPAWIIDYESELVHLERWRPGPPIAKSEVVLRGKEGRLFPPKTTRHRLLLDLPARPTPLADLLAPSGTAKVHSRTSERS
jgi:L-serine kinase (ADP)